MPSHLISLPGVRPPTFGVPLGSTLNYMSVSAVRGNTTKPTAVSTKYATTTAQSTVFAPTHIVSQPKTY